MSETPYRAVLCTCPNPQSAQEIAEALVDARLAAGVSIISGVRSVYRWRGKVEDHSELLMVIRTHEKRIPDLEQVIRERHPYEVPEIIALTIDSGLPEYLAWLDDAAGSAQAPS